MFWQQCAQVVGWGATCMLVGCACAVFYMGRQGRMQPQGATQFSAHCAHRPAGSAIMRSLGRSLLFPLLAAGHPSSGGAPRRGEEPFPPLVQGGTFLAIIGDSYPDRQTILAAVHQAIGDAHLWDPFHARATAECSSTISFGHQRSYLSGDASRSTAFTSASSTSTWASLTWGATTASSATPAGVGRRPASPR